MPTKQTELAFLVLYGGCRDGVVLAELREKIEAEDQGVVSGAH